MPAGLYDSAQDTTPIACASRTAHVPCLDCPGEKVCTIRLLMLDVRNTITGVLDETSLADMMASRAVPSRSSSGVQRPDATDRGTTVNSRHVVIVRDGAKGALAAAHLLRDRKAGFRAF